MDTNGNRPIRPKRIAPDQVDDAVDEALERVEEGNELDKDDLDKVTGGTEDPPPTVGFLTKET